MSNHPILLVAAREIAVRLRSKAFRIVTAVTALGLIGFMLFAGFRAGQRHDYQVAHTPDVSSSLLARLGSLEAALDADVEPVSVADRDAAVAAVRSNRAELGLVGTDEVIINRGLAAQDTSPRARFLVASVEIVRTQRGLEAAGLTPETAAGALSAPAPQMTALRPAPPAPRGRAAAWVGILVLFIMINTYANWVSSAVMREKTTRLSELLLVTLKPRDLLAGKLLGVGALAISHAILLALIGFGARLLIGGGTLADFNTTLSSLLWPVAWFVVGFALYSALYAAAGSLVKTQEDAPTLPLFALLMLGYITSSTLLTGGEASTYHHFLAWFPLTAPFNMLALVGIGAVPTWQALASLGVSVLAVPLVLRLAGGIYAAAVVRTGTRVKWSEALRPSALRRARA